jgi:hypothetical protein
VNEGHIENLFIPDFTPCAAILRLIRRMKVVFDAMPAPVIKTGNIPTALAAVVRLVYLAQKGPDTPVIRFALKKAGGEVWWS